MRSLRKSERHINSWRESSETNITNILEKIHIERVNIYVEINRIDIGNLESKIKWSAFFKILVLVVIAVGQIFILTGFFKNKRNISV
jgi:hypothetical protein